MTHPIHFANENSPYGDLTKEEFYKKHQILHKEGFILNHQNMRIFTQSWQPKSIPIRGLIAMVHGYTSESSWVFELTAIHLAKGGFLACALDLQGHGYSDGLAGHIPNIEPIVGDCIQFFDSMKADHPNLPAFLYGESLGGAIAILTCLKQTGKWDGLVLNGPMCGVSAKFKPIWPIEKLLSLAALLAPTWKLVISKPLACKSYKEEWKRTLVKKNPNHRASRKPSAATALEFLRVCEYIKLHCHELEVPMLIVHGEYDSVCDSNSVEFVYKLAASNDKTLKIFPGMWHQLIGEPDESVELVYGTILSWFKDHANKARRNRIQF